jgi:hypothetical protein
MTYTNNLVSEMLFWKSHDSIPDNSLRVSGKQIVVAQESAARMAGHSLRTSSEEYGVVDGLVTGATGLDICRQFDVSRTWHQHVLRGFVDISISTEETAGGIDLSSAQMADEELASVSFFSAKTPNPICPIPCNPDNIGTHARASLAKLFGPNADWSCEQQLQAVKSAVGDKHFLAVLPTGAGKSLVFLIYAMLHPQRITLVVVPTLSLRDSIVSRVTESSAGVLVATDLKVVDRGLVIMTYEKFNVSFDVFLSKWITGSIHRVFLDEGHAIVNCPFISQSKLNIFPRIRVHAKGCILSATIDQRVESQLKSLFGVTDVIRKSSDRPNLQYVMEECPARLRCPEILNLIANLGQSEWRVLIYCHSIARVEEIFNILSETVGVTKYHASLEDIEKSRSTVMWNTGLKRIMVATTAFLEGIDCGTVRLVVIDGIPYSMFDFVQMAGRGGRDGHPAICKMFFSDFEAVDDKRMEVLLVAKGRRGCIRRCITSTFDGELGGFSCHDRPCQICNMCSRRSLTEAVDDMRRNEKALVALDSEYKRFIEQSREIKCLLRFMKSQFCAVCFADNLSLDSTHTFDSCPLLGVDSRRCLSCFNASAFHVPHFSDCPFFLKSYATRIPICGLCWLPNAIGNECAHGGILMGNKCGFFATKIAWIYRRSRDLKKQGGGLPQLLLEYKHVATEVEDGILNGIRWLATIENRYVLDNRYA